MNLRQIETFYWAARLGSFSAASQRLNATQSTVSMRIQELERDLGVALFDRTQRNARVTGRGRELMLYAEEMLRLAADMREKVGHEDATAGFVRIGVAEVISITWLPRLMTALHERFPKISVELDEALTRDLVAKLRAGALDLVLAPGRIHDYGVVPVPLGRLKFAWMASPELELPDEPATPRELEKWPIITLSQESHHHASIEGWFRAGGANIRRVDTCKSMNVAASLAAAGIGLTLLPVRCAEADIASGRLRIVHSDPPFPDVDFAATPSADNLQPISHRIALLARDVSDFDRSED